MNRYPIIILLFCITSLLRSQNFVVEYEYEKRIKKDSSETVKQNTFLNVEDTKSLFFSEAPYLEDSIIAADNRLGKKTNFKGLPYDAVNCFISKDLPKKEITYYSDEFDENEFTYKEQADFEWKIVKEKKIIMGYSVQMAKTQYAGRNYTAFFTSQIPVQDGPYKFSGLPGLILELFDDKMDHHFTAIAITKEKKMSLDRISKRKYVETTRSKFLKMRENYIQAPLQRMFEMMNSTQIYEKKDANGNTVDLKKLFNDTQKKMIEEYKTENKIELQN